MSPGATRLGRFPSQPQGPVEEASKRLAELTHELSGLLDGSMRTVNLVLTSRDEGQQVASETDEMARRLRTVRTALEQMAGMVQAAIRAGDPGRSRRRLPLPQLTLNDAVCNAVAILEPLATEHGVLVRARVHDAAQSLPAGPVYTLVVNGVRNAIESVSRRGDRSSARRVDIEVELAPKGETGKQVVLTISDNGEGPPPADRQRQGKLFQPGFSTKPGGAGLGLALCRDLLMQFGGTVQLTAREEGPGAALTARYPAPVMDRK